jgi:hypothetical protein
MADDTPSPTPEGQLIRQVRDLSIPKLTIRAAAALIGLSAEQWGYIERGYYPARDGNPPRPFSPPAVTLAKMAHVLDITPERLESEGQRPDAAKILREIQGREAQRNRKVPTTEGPIPSWKIREILGEQDGLPTDASGPIGKIEDRTTVIPAGSLPSAPMNNAARENADRAYATPIWERLLRFAAQGVTDPTGAQIFGEGTDDAKAWDGIGRRLPVGDRVWFIADLQRRVGGAQQTNTG